MWTSRFVCRSGSTARVTGSGGSAPTLVEDAPPADDDDDDDDERASQ
jgi:hypothetical protein